MHKPSKFALNLKRLQGGLSLAEFSRELSIPKSTPQSILKDGNTTLDTALRIANSIETPLDILTGATFTPRQFKLMHCFLVMLNWYHDLSAEKRQQVHAHLSALLCVIDESCDGQPKTDFLFPPGTCYADSLLTFRGIFPCLPCLQNHPGTRLPSLLQSVRTTPGPETHRRCSTHLSRPPDTFLIVEVGIVRTF